MTADTEASREKGGSSSRGRLALDLGGRRLVVVSNRLPVAINATKDGSWSVEAGTGGLITALAPIVRATGGKWIGWPGCPADAPAEELLAGDSRMFDFDLAPVSLTEAEIGRYYRGFANRSVWPLFHDLLGQFSFDPEEFLAYKMVNKKFAARIADQARDDDLFWIHDYQLMYVARYLHRLAIEQPLHFFLHIPFPSYDLLRRFPHNRELLTALLEYDHLGFQTAIDRRNFISSVKWLLPDAVLNSGRRRSTVRFHGRETLVGYYPISIDFRSFNEDARTQPVAEAAWYLRENTAVDCLVLGLDRLDYTKGIKERFRAFERLLERHPDTIGKISLLQVVVPSRLNVPDYQELKRELDFEAGRINSRFSIHGWTPIFYQFRTLDRVQLLGHYKASDMALITPLRDGMNLVAKEYCAANVNDHGVLVLSHFAGAAAQLSKGALMVNPYDFEETAEAIYRGFSMEEEERNHRMKLMRAEIRQNDVARWVRQFFGQ